MSEKRLRTMDDVLLDGKEVLVRVDFNVSVGEDGVVDATEDYRIEAAVPTLEELEQRRCKIILVTHLGRPQEGEGSADLTPVQRRLEDIVKSEVRMLASYKPDEVAAAVAGMEPGAMALLPNVRLDAREKTASVPFAEELAAVGEVYVNEAFSVSHRDHASVSVLPTLLPSCAGRRTVLEYETLISLRRDPQTPYVAIVSGAKVHTKVDLLRELLKVVDKLCVGGRIANAFLTAGGHCSAGTCDDLEVEAAKEVLTAADDKLVLPTDVVVGTEDGDEIQLVSVEEIPDGVGGIWDIGPVSVDRFLAECKQARTVMWNGPLGRFEVEEYAKGTMNFAAGLAESEARRVVGGGDLVHALETRRLMDKFDHVSVAGGAMLALLEGQELPGLIPLYRAED